MIAAVPTTVLQLDAGAAGLAFLVGRVLFGVVLAFTGLNHFFDVDAMAGYAEAKGVPAPRLSVLASGGTLIFGGLGVAAGVFPALAAGGIVLFLLVTTPTMHDFWAVPAEQRQNEMTQFLKNATMLGAALAILALSGTPWPYAVGIGL